MTRHYDDSTSKVTLVSGRNAPQTAQAGRVVTTTRINLLRWLGGVLIFLICLFLAVGGYLFYAFKRSVPSSPIVHIEEPRREDDLIVGNPSLVIARAEDPDQITKAELWVNGQLVASQANAAGENPFHVNQAWRPTSAGAYTLFVRATDTKGYVGQSVPLLINVSGKSEPAAGAVSQVGLDGGGGESTFIPFSDDSAPPSGEISDNGAYPTVSIPEPPLIPPPGDVTSAEPVLPAFYSGIGRLCLFVPALCSDPSDASPFTPSPLNPGDSRVPDWGSDLCRALPSLPGCLGAGHPGLLPPNPPRVFARYGGLCQIEIYWTDESTDEIGFEIYRSSSGPESNLIALTNTSGMFVDHLAAGGNYRYYVSAYNAQGGSPSAPTDEIIVPASDCVGALTSAITSLDLEALTMTMTESMDRMYCYYSVAGAPYTRVPDDPAQFMELGEGGWNIADYAGGNNRLRISLPIGGALEVAGECLGWRGSELVDLGGFRQAHLPDEWDGRTLSASSGRFTVTYSIQPPPTETVEGSPMFIVDPSIPAPYNIRLGNFTTSADCSTRGASGGGCAVEEEWGGLQWDWEPAPGDIRRLVGFDVYYRLAGLHDGVAAGESFGRIGDVVRPRERYYWTNGEMSAPSAFSNSMPCVINTQAPLQSFDLGRVRDPSSGLVFPPNLDSLLDGIVVAQDVYYSVKALVTDGRGGVLESPLSEEHWVGLSGCPYLLVVRLDDLWAYDGTVCEAYREDAPDDAADLYGWMDVDGSRFWWNCPYCDNPASYAASWEGLPPPHDTSIICDGFEGIQLENLALSLESPDGSVSGFSRGNIVTLVPMRSPFDTLTVGYAFYDFDSEFREPDDLWCAERQEFRPETGWGEALDGMSWYVESTKGEYLTDYDITCAIEVTTYFLEFLP